MVLCNLAVWFPDYQHQLFPPVPCDASGEAAQQGGGNPDAAVDLHQVLPGNFHIIFVNLQND